MVDQLNSFAAEVTRVAREVGTEGKLGGQADVKGVAGVWKDLTENVNLMAGNLTAQVRNIALVATAVATGDLSKKITVDVKGEILELKNTLNTMVDQLNSFAAEVTRVAREVGTEGKLGGQADVKGVAGVWKDLTDNVNSMAGNLTDQVRGIANVVTAVATGDLSRKITVDVKGEILELKNTINVMVDQLNSFAAEVTRVAREVGTEGKLGGQADVKGVAGVWKDLTDNVNSMASNLTDQVRGIVKVVTAVANGDLERQLTVEAKGEIAALADTINGMIETLATFADQVTTVAREVGVEGQLGGQARVPGAAGTWRDLTDNVNQLAANLTTQMRAIAEVATAVTTGDLTRSIAVEASGEVAALKDNINEMIRHLRDTTQKNTDQDWLKTNLAKFSRMLQGQKDLLTVGRLILSELAPVVYAQHGVFYILETSGSEPELRLLASYAHRERQNVGNRFGLGEGLVGQCALEKDKIVIHGAPPDYIRISSGLGETAPVNVIVLPVLFEGQVKAVLELGSLQPFNLTQHAFLDQLAETIGIVLNTIEANTRTEDLLKQSQSLATELQNQQEELRETNQQLEEKAQLLAEQNAEVERKNREIDKARLALEEKATQLALTSKYKSEFLANMSHELRTPLNSLLILSDELSRNADQNLTSRQTEFAKTIHSSGTDLLTLINDILDLSKIESGTVSLEVGDVRFADLAQFVERTFRHVAEAKGLRFLLALSPELPRLLQTDAKRLQQVMKNLLSNAFKFTERGSVTLSVELARDGWNSERETLNRAGERDRVLGERHRHRNPAREAPDHLRSLPAGGRQHEPPLRRHRAGPQHQPRDRDAAGGRASRGEHVRRGQHLHALPPARPIRRAKSLPRALARSACPSSPQRCAGSAARWTRRRTPRWIACRTTARALTPESRVLLIVENDDAFARFLLEVARERGWQGVVASSGASAVALARDVGPHAVTLDMRLPDIDGWRLLRLFKADLETRHLPVLVISTDDEAERAYGLGAIGVLAKPVANRETLEHTLLELAGAVDRSGREVLIVGGGGHASVAGGGARGGRRAARDLRVRSNGSPPAARAGHVSTASSSSRRRLPGRSPGSKSSNGSLVREHPRVASSTTSRARKQRPGRRAPTAYEPPRSRRRSTPPSLLLHRRAAELPPSLRSVIESARRRRQVLAGRKVLLVDDDIRNIFALTSVLEKHEMNVLSAESGQGAIELLEANPGVDVVADGCHDARHGRLRDHARDAKAAAVPRASDHRGHGARHEGRSGEDAARGSVGLSREAGRARTHAGGARGLVAGLGARLGAEQPIEILVVDDRPAQRRALTAVVGDLGADVVEAASGRDALRLLLQRDFAVILLDVNMPGIDGFETASLIRQRMRSEQTPIIFVTAYGDETHAARGYQLGAVDYIQQPVDPQALRSKVSVFVELHRKTEEATRHAESLRRHAAQLRQLADLSLAVHGAGSVDELLELVAGAAASIVGAEQVAAELVVETDAAARRCGGTKQRSPRRREARRQRAVRVLPERALRRRAARDAPGRSRARCASQLGDPRACQRARAAPGLARGATARARRTHHGSDPSLRQAQRRVRRGGRDAAGPGGADRFDRGREHALQGRPGGEPTEGPVPRDPLARAAHATPGVAELGEPSPGGRVGSGAAGARARGHRAQRPRAEAAHRRPVGRVADHDRQADAWSCGPSRSAA